MGVGNPWRGDDAVGLAVARHVRRLAPPGVVAVEHDGQAAALIEAWAGAQRVVVVDAARAAAGTTPGAILRADASTAPLPAALARRSTHALGLAEAIELSRALGCLPAHMAVVCVVGWDFTPGRGLTPAVTRAVAPAAEAALAALAAGRRSPRARARP